PPLRVVGTASSAGGMRALAAVLERLPADFAGALVAVQHLQEGRQSLLPELLARTSPLPVEEAADGTRLRAGHVYTAPAGRHIRLAPGPTLSLSDEAPVAFSRPSADPFLESLARVCGPRAVAVVLSGSLGDGAAGVRAVHRAGGIVLAQDPATAEHPGMPRAAIRTGCVHQVLPLERIAGALLALAAGEPASA
ncbi:MAG TPA: chemotaxis protein CheB, partial [Longimicrobium sp.]|nr:chemotaxis protein CheB [Longimicrobium sp.]